MKLGLEHRRQLPGEKLLGTPEPLAQAFGGLADTLGFPASLLICQLLNPVMTDRIIALMGDNASSFDPLLHNTVNPTIRQGGDKINVIPSEITVKLDGRLLPGQTPDDMLRELRGLLGTDIELEVFDFDPGPPEPDMSLFGTLADILKKPILLARLSL